MPDIEFVVSSIMRVNLISELESLLLLEVTYIIYDFEYFS